MRRFVSFILVCMLLLGLSGESGGPVTSNNGDGGSKGEGGSKVEATVKAANANDLMQALRDAGYRVEKQDDVTAQDRGMENAETFTVIGFYKDEDGVEKMGEITFMKFGDFEEAMSAYYDIVSMCTSDGIPLRDSNTVTCMRSTYTDDADPDFGEAYVVAHLEDIVIMAIETWDIDSSGSYDHEMENILKKLGY